MFHQTSLIYKQLLNFSARYIKIGFLERKIFVTWFVLHLFVYSLANMNDIPFIYCEVLSMAPNVTH